MKVIHWTECEEKQIDRFPYRGKQLDVIGTSIRWLSQHGEDENGIPEYGLRFFTIQPGGQIPIHNHFYHQTMYILLCTGFQENFGRRTCSRTKSGFRSAGYKGFRRRPDIFL